MPPQNLCGGILWIGRQKNRRGPPRLFFIFFSLGLFLNRNFKRPVAVCK